MTKVEKPKTDAMFGAPDIKSSVVTIFTTKDGTQFFDREKAVKHVRELRYDAAKDFVVDLMDEAGGTCSYSRDFDTDKAARAVLDRLQEINALVEGIKGDSVEIVNALPDVDDEI